MAWSSTRSGSASWHRVNCTWLVKNMALSAVAVFLRLSWRTVSGIVTRVVAELTGKTDQLDGLRRIGIDKIAYGKGHRYLTCAVDHDTGRLVWAHEGRNKDTLSKFFQDLGEFQIRCVDACVGRRRGVDPRGGERARTAGGALPGSVLWRPPDYADVVARSAGGGGIAAPIVGVIIAVDTAQAGELIDQPGGERCQRPGEPGPWTDWIGCAVHGLAPLRNRRDEPPRPPNYADINDAA